MVQLIVGNRGSGKTKALIRKVNDAAKVTKGNVVCIEQGDSLKFDIKSPIRLIGIEEYNIRGADAYYGFIAGLLAGNYDITELFGDATFRILCGKGNKDVGQMTAFLEKVEALSKNSGVTIIFTVSCDPSDLPEHIQAMIIND